MRIVHHMTLCARQGRSPELGQCLAGLWVIHDSASGCLMLNIQQSHEQPLRWQVESRWCSVQAREAFLAGEILRQVLAVALRDGLLNSLSCEEQRFRRVA